MRGTLQCKILLWLCFILAGSIQLHSKVRALCGYTVVRELSVTVDTVCAVRWNGP